MQHPDYADQFKCSFSGCQVLGCKGDRVERVTEAGQAKLKVVVAHGKTSDHHGNEPLQMILPPSWTRAVQPWVEEGHAVVAAGCR